MKKYISFAFLSAFTLFSNVSFADVCLTDPSCYDMGYYFSASECSGMPSISCPFNEAAKFCNRTNWKPCEVGDVYDINQKACMKDETGDYVVVQTTAAGTCRIMDRKVFRLVDQYSLNQSMSIQQWVSNGLSYCTNISTANAGTRMVFLGNTPHFHQILYDSGKIINDNPQVRYVYVTRRALTTTSSDGTKNTYYYDTFMNLDNGTYEEHIATATGVFNPQNMGILCVSNALVPCNSTKLYVPMLYNYPNYYRTCRAGSYNYTPYYKASGPMMCYSYYFNIFYMNPNITTLGRSHIITSGYSIPFKNILNNYRPKEQYGQQVWGVPDTKSPATDGTIKVAYSWIEAMDICDSAGGRLVDKKGVAAYLYSIKRRGELMSVPANVSAIYNGIRSGFPELFYTRETDEYGYYYPGCYNINVAETEDAYSAGFNSCPDEYDGYYGTVICEFPTDLYAPWGQ